MLSTAERREPVPAGGSSSLLRTVGPADVFNLPLYEHHLVMDLRPSREYSRGHMATAVSFPYPPLQSSEAEREQLLIDFIASYAKQYMRPENPSPILLYGDNSPASRFHSEWLAQRLEHIQRERKAVSQYVPQTLSVEEPGFDYFEHFCLTIADSAKEIWILECSYEEFAAEYSFLCGHVDFMTMEPLPHRITKHIFLGSRVIPLTHQALSVRLGITHMIVSRHQKLDWEELRDISVLTCDVRDSNSQAMMECWTACVRFITEIELREGRGGEGERGGVGREEEREGGGGGGEGEGGRGGGRGGGREEGGGEEGGEGEGKGGERVLVMLFGRSRSASVVLAHLIMSRGMSLDEAWRVLREKCWHLIDKSLAYEDQLREWEKVGRTPSIDL